LEIDIEYKGQKMSLPIELVKWGYTYRAVIVIKDAEVFFEPDEEGSYRAIVQDSTVEIDARLLEAISTELAPIRG
jgi:hypothetical protein